MGQKFPGWDNPAEVMLPPSPGGEEDLSGRIKVGPELFLAEGSKNKERARCVWRAEKWLECAVHGRVENEATGEVALGGRGPGQPHTGIAYSWLGWSRSASADEHAEGDGETD